MAAGAQRGRSRARRRAVQALYEWQVGGGEAGAIERQFLAGSPRDLDADYFRAALRGVVAGHEALDDALAPLLDRPLAQLDPVERAILRLGAWELTERLDIPYRVVLNEAIELARRFGAEQSHRFVNGVLDRLAGELPLRRAERGMASEGQRR